MTYLNSSKDDDLTVGEATIPRRMINTQSSGSTNGFVRLSYFTARKSETITQVRTNTGATAAVTPTLCRIGVYEVDASGNLTLVASTANDTTLWAATLTAYTKSFSVSFAKKRGTRYAVGHLVVGSATAPQFIGSTGVTSAEAGIAPRLAALLSGQTDLPSSISAGTLSDTSANAYHVLLP